MPPQLALLICTVFVGWLLWIDYKASQGVSWALWAPSLWMLYCASRPISAWFSADLGGGDNVEAGSPMDRLFLIVLLAVGIFTLRARRLNYRQIFSENKWFFVFFGYMALSIIWSDYEFVSFKRWVRACGSILMAMMILSDPKPRKALEAVLRRSAYVLIPFSILLVKYFSERGHDYNQWTGERMWVGVTTQKNCLGRLCLISGFFLVWQLIRRRRKTDLGTVKFQTYADLVVLAMTGLLLVGSSSATSLAVLMLGLGIFLVLGKMKGFILRAGTSLEIAVITVIVVIGVSYLLFGSALLAGLVGLLGRDLTFTGRTEIWALLMPIAAKHPILGMGYGSFWINSPLPWRGLNEGHNGYLDVTLELGLVGLFLLFVYLLSFYRQARNGLTKNFDLAAFNIAFLIMALIHNVTETSFARSTTHLWVIMIFLTVASPKLYRVNSLRKKPVVKRAGQPAVVAAPAASPPSGEPNPAAA